MCKMYRLSSVCYQHLRSSGADVRALMVQGVAVTMVPKGRNVHEEVGDGTTTFTVKFVGAGACTVPGIAGSGAGIGSVVGRRYYSTGVNNSKKEEKIEPAKNIEDVDGMVFEYTEGSRQPYLTNPDLKTISLPEACAWIGKLQTELLTKSEELRKLKAPAAARSRMEFYERENELTMYNLKEEEKREMAKISDLKEKKIKQVYFKWRFLLSPDNPKFNLDINQQLLRRISEENIDLEVFLRAVGNVFDYTASRWYELFDMNGEPVQILKVKSYDEAVACLFEKTTKK